MSNLATCKKYDFLQVARLDNLEASWVNRGAVWAAARHVVISQIGVGRVPLPVGSTIVAVKRASRTFVVTTVIYIIQRTAAKILLAL
jgi:hypothetical protein